MDLHDSAEKLLTARRILVLGSSGSGKTTLTLELAHLLKLDPIHLDACFWRPGWQETPQHQWREKVRELIERETWIMDGTYESTLDLRLPAADVAIILERSRWSCLWNVLKRKLTIDDQHRLDAPPGQPINRAFLRYVWRYPRVTHAIVIEALRRHGRHLFVVQLGGSKDFQALIQSVRNLCSAQ